MLISSTLSKGPERIYQSSNRRKSLVNIPTRPRNSSQRYLLWMEEYCVRSDAIFWYHGRVDLDEANPLSLATRPTASREVSIRRFQFLPVTAGMHLRSRPSPTLPCHPRHMPSSSTRPSIHHSCASAVLPSTPPCSTPSLQPFPRSSGTAAT